MLYRPVRVPYERLKEAGGMGAIGMIEQAPAFGKGWIGVTKPADYQGALEIKKISQEFMMHEHVGAYAKMGLAYRQIMKDHKKVRNFFNLYVNDPSKNEEEDYITQILFQV